VGAAEDVKRMLAASLAGEEVEAKEVEAKEAIVVELLVSRSRCSTMVEELVVRTFSLRMGVWRLENSSEAELALRVRVRGLRSWFRMLTHEDGDEWS